MDYTFKLIIRLILSFMSIIFYRIYYIIFGPLTLNISAYIISLFTKVIVSENMLYIGEFSFRFIDACVAASAYILITLLVLLTKGIKLKTRLKMLGLGYLLFLGFNILRIELLFLILLLFGHNVFNTLHVMIWLFFSTLVVFFIWIFLIKFFKIKNIPIYSDIQYLVSKIKK